MKFVEIEDGVAVFEVSKYISPNGRIELNPVQVKQGFKRRAGRGEEDEVAVEYVKALEAFEMQKMNNPLAPFIKGERKVA